MTAWLVVGLGNPGKRYAHTRHNLGARVVERLAERLGARFRKVRFLPIDAAEARSDGEPLLLARPHTYMNVSGPPVASLARKRRIEPDRIVVCHDEIDLAFGSLKVKRGGSTAGHHGLDSVARSLRSPDFYRIRLGVGRPSGRKDPADHVLEPFTAGERDGAEAMLEQAADAVLTLVRDGLTMAQSRFNRVGPPR
jgi:PTH1 family peptidyl-tRNA hydrolase